MRLIGPAFRPSAAPVRLSVDGRALEALPGESLAAAMAAAGLRGTGRGRGRDRAPFCGMGVCQDCVVQVAGAGRVRACLVPVTADMAVTTDADPWSAQIGPPGDGQPEALECDLLIIGAGPAGLAAACAAREAGAAVIVADERPSPGGQYFKPLAASLAFAAGPADAQYAAGLALTSRARDCGVVLWPGAVVWGAFPGPEIAAEVAGRGAVVVRPRRLVLATGAHEWVRPVPGWTLPGVMTTGAAQTLLRAARVAPGQRVLVAGRGPLNLQLAAELTEAGVEVVACVEEAPAPGLGRAGALLAALAADPALIAQGLRHRARLLRAGVPVLHDMAVTRVLGEAQATGAEVGPLGRAGAPRRFEADAICLNHGFLPNAELALQLGARARQDAEGAWLVERDKQGRTSIPGVFLAGDGAGLGGAQAALAEGEIAGRAAAIELGFQAGSDAAARAALARHRRFQAALWRLFAPAAAPPAPPPETVLCRCEGLTLGTIRAACEEARAEIGGVTLPEIKRRTRLGMGPCQGRYCLPGARRLCGELPREAPRARPPARPVSVAALAAEKPEWVRHRLTEPPAAPSAPRVDVAEEETEVAIIGAGVVGLCLALDLARAGIATVLLDRGTPGAGASGANAGSLHVQLQSHLARLPQAGRDRAAAILPLSLAGVERWSAIAADLGGFELRRQGGLMLAASPAEATLLRDKVALERAWGLDVELLERPGIRRRFPFVAPGIEVAGFCPAEGMVDPLAANRVLLGAALAAGVRVEGHRAVAAVEQTADGWRLITDRGALRCRRMVLAAGPSAGRFAREQLGVDLPLGATALHMNVTEPAPPLIAPLIEHAGRHLTMKQLGAGNIVIGGGWPGEGAEDGTLHSPRASIEGNLWVAQSLVPAVAGLRVIRTWTGLTTVCEDELPVLGELPGLPGAFACVTHTGYTLGPICARLLAERLCGRAPSLDITPFLAEHRAMTRQPAPVASLQGA